MERMSGLDASFLYFETPNMHMHVCGVIVSDPSSVPGGYSFEKVREMVEARIHLVPQFRRRLVSVPFRLHHPVWIQDPDFDLDYHLRRVACPSPGTMEQLSEMAGEIASRQLDRERPLWEMHLVEGLENGHVATIAKMHHCTVDGVSGANLLVYLFDLTPEGDEKPPPPEEQEVDRRPSDAELVAYAVNSRLRRPLQLAKVVPDTLRSVVNVVQNRLQGEGSGGATPLTAPRTSFNATITPHRKVAFTRVPLEDIKAVKNAFGTTVNDVVLAMASGALRRYLEKQGELPEKSLIATVPVSVRSESAEAKDVVSANQVSAMFTSLATDVDDPVERLMTINDATKGAKQEHNAVGADMLQNWAQFAAPTTFSLAARFYTRLRLADRHPVVHNLVISNVPGPPMPLYFAGSKLVSLNPLGPIFDGAGLNITVISYMDSVDWGFMACRELMPNLWDLAHAVPDALAELQKAAEERS